MHSMNRLSFDCVRNIDIKLLRSYMAVDAFQPPRSRYKMSGNLRYVSKTVSMFGQVELYNTPYHLIGQNTLTHPLHTTYLLCYRYYNPGKPYDIRRENIL